MNIGVGTSWEQYKKFGDVYYGDSYTKRLFDDLTPINQFYMYVMSDRYSMHTTCNKPNLHHFVSQPVYSSKEFRDKVPVNLLRIKNPQPLSKILSIHNPIFALMPASIYSWAVETLNGCDVSKTPPPNDYVKRLIEEKRPKWFRNRFGVQGDYINMGKTGETSRMLPRYGEVVNLELIPDEGLFVEDDE